MRVEIWEGPFTNTADIISDVREIVKKEITEVKHGVKKPLTLLIPDLDANDVIALKNKGYRVRVYEW